MLATLVTLMAAGKLPAKNFEAVLERTPNRLHWVIARVPFEVGKAWGTRGQLRVQGEINGFSFRGVLFPTRRGEHFLLVNKKLQAAAKTAPGLKAKFRLAPDTTPRAPAAPSKELLRELGQSKRLLKFYESLSNSRRNYFASWVAEVKHADARKRRAQQIAECLFETMEAERELPPLVEMAFQQNPRAREDWARLSPAGRRNHLMGVFYSRSPESRSRRLAKCMEELVQKAGSRRSDDFTFPE